MGERNAKDEADGRGVQMYKDGEIRICYWKNGSYEVPGNYIMIERNGTMFSFGERYADAKGKLWRRGTNFMPNGSSKKFDTQFDK